MLEHEAGQGLGRTLAKMLEEAVVQFTREDLVALVVRESGWSQTCTSLLVARRKVGAEVRPTFRSHRLRRNIRFGVHPRPTGERAHGAGGPVQRRTFADGDVAHLLGRRQTEHKGAVIGQAKRFTDGVHLSLRDAVGREFVAVEDPAHASQFGRAGQFPAEAWQLCTLVVERLGSKQT